MKILICEDEEIMLTAIEFRLRKQGYEVVRAIDGKEAFSKIETEAPDLIVTDIAMPFYSGIDVIRHVRQTLKISLPLIVITALEEEDVVLEALRLGANDFITKPFKPAELILRIKRLFLEMRPEPAPVSGVLG